MWHAAGNGHAPRAAASFGQAARAPRGRWVLLLVAAALLAGLLSTSLATGRLFERAPGGAPMLRWTKPLPPSAGGGAASPFAAAADAAAAIAATAGEALPRGDAGGAGEELGLENGEEEESAETWEDELLDPEPGPPLPAAAAEAATPTAAAAAVKPAAAGEAVVPIAAAAAGSADDATADELTAAANAGSDEAASPSALAPTGADAPAPPTSACAAASHPPARPPAPARRLAPPLLRRL